MPAKRRNLINRRVRRYYKRRTDLRAIARLTSRAMSLPKDSFDYARVFKGEEIREFHDLIWSPETVTKEVASLAALKERPKDLSNLQITTCFKHGQTYIAKMKEGNMHLHFYPLKHGGECSIEPHKTRGILWKLEITPMARFKEPARIEAGRFSLRDES